MTILLIALCVIIVGLFALIILGLAQAKLAEYKDDSGE